MLIVYLVLASFIAFIGLLIFCMNFFGGWASDEDGAMIGALIFVGGWLWPIVLPLAVFALLVAMIMHICIMFGLMKEPEWWPTA